MKLPDGRFVFPFMIEGGGKFRAHVEFISEEAIALKPKCTVLFDAVKLAAHLNSKNLTIFPSTCLAGEDFLTIFSD